MLYSLKKLTVLSLLFSSTLCIEDKLITFDLEHGSLMSDGSILPGDHRKPLFDNVLLDAYESLYADETSNLIGNEDVDVVSKLDDFKDI